MTSSRYTPSSSSGSSVQSLMVEVRAATSGFAQDLSAMRSNFDTSLVSGFTKAGSVLDTSLSTALKKGTSGFTDLRATALSALGDIAQQATGLFSGGSGSSSGNALASLVSAISGLPGRATGGPVSPGQAYVVGERGPELFVPTSAGSIASNGAAGGKDARAVNVSINLAGTAGGDAPQALARSSRQMASALRRALSRT